ncbi:MAG: transposase [Rhodobacteraceae bacterium]|nr:transposase [Paracoccaceae bacterium]
MSAGSRSGNRRGRRNPPPGALSVPAVAGFREWHAVESKTERLPKDPFLKALNHAGPRRAQLEIFLSDPDVPVDTNHLERCVRPVACGRKNRLSAWTGDGAERTASIRSLLFTCALHGVDPYVWLTDVLQRVADHPMSRVRGLIPRGSVLQL